MRTSLARTSPARSGLRFAAGELLMWLRSGVAPGSFLIETEFDAGTPTFLSAHRLPGLNAHGTLGSLGFARVRPGVIEVVGPGGVGAEHAQPWGQRSTARTSPVANLRSRHKIRNGPAPTILPNPGTNHPDGASNS